jgi:hypothetical protein
MEVSSQIHTLGREAPVPIEQEAGWAPELFCMLCLRGKSLAWPGIKP